MAFLILEITPSDRAAAYSRSFFGAFRFGESIHFFRFLHQPEILLLGFLQNRVGDNFYRLVIGNI